MGRVNCPTCSETMDKRSTRCSACLKKLRLAGQFTNRKLAKVEDPTVTCKCGVTHTYKKLHQYHEAIAKPGGWKCRSCRKLGTKMSDEARHNMKMAQHKYHGTEPREKENRNDIKSELKEWRKAVYKKDDYRCQYCLEQGKKLNAHHIFSVAKHFQLALNVDNGITLCEDCHKWHHKHNPLT